MNRFNPRKLKLSKWTARRPHDKEKHFLVTDLAQDEDGVLRQIELQAVYSQRCQWLDWRELRDADKWLMGWQ